MLGISDDLDLKHGSSGRTRQIPVCPDLLRFDRVLRENEVHVWHADLRNVPPLKSLYELLGPEERDRARRFKVDAARDQFVVSHAFLRLALADYLEV